MLSGMAHNVLIRNMCTFLLVLYKKHSNNAMVHFKNEKNVKEADRPA
jgi:hypothetical protein